jgi:hypothetical protein
MRPLPPYWLTLSDGRVFGPFRSYHAVTTWIDCHSDEFTAKIKITGHGLMHEMSRRVASYFQESAR